MKYKAFLMLLTALLVCLFSCGEMPDGENADENEYSVEFYHGEQLYCVTAVDADECVQKPTDPEREGYDFEGWYLNGEKWDFSGVPESDLMLEAKWSVNFKALFPHYTDQGIEFAKDGSCLILDANMHDIVGYYDEDILVKIKEANKALGLHKDLYFQMLATTSQEGIRAIEGEYVTVEWTNSPSTGLRVIYTKK